MRTGIALLLVPCLLAAPLQAEKEAVAPAAKIYLPREKFVDGPRITLDDIAMVTGEDSIVQRARSLKLGRAPLPGETIILNRQTIRARLASQNLFEDDVKMVGAKEISIRRDSRLITTVDLINLAEVYLQNHMSTEGVSWRLKRKPEPILIPEGLKADLACELDPGAPTGHVRVIVRARTAEKTVDRREMLFQTVHKSQQAIAVRPIAPGEEITPQNTRIEPTEVPRQPKPWKSPFGARAKKAIQPGAVIREHLVSRPKPIVRVRRNQTVRIKLEGPGWVITALGAAMQNGATGDIIKVQNLDSRRIIPARVDEAGDVVPLIHRQ
jgi:flagella basal body P-ring formation protein FlgA